MQIWNVSLERWCGTEKTIQDKYMIFKDNAEFRKYRTCFVFIFNFHGNCLRYFCNQLYLMNFFLRISTIEYFVHEALRDIFK